MRPRQISGAGTGAAEAAASAAAALVSQNAAAASATAASGSATTAGTSAGAASSSASAASGSASAASGSASAASGSASTASTSATNSGNSATAAAASAAAALVSQNAAAASVLLQLSSQRGLVGKNNATTPNTQFDFNASVIILIGADESARKVAGSSKTNNISTAGPAANGRDQSGAFTNSTWVHFWWIYNGTTLATLSSASATAPTIPSGYTHKAYIGAVYLTSGGTLRSTRINGDLVSLAIGTDGLAISAGAATSETSVSIAAFVPPNASEFECDYEYYNSTGAIVSSYLRLVSGETFASINAGPTNNYERPTLTCPYVSSTIYYLNSAAGGLVFAALNKFRIPNGSM